MNRFLKINFMSKIYSVRVTALSSWLATHSDFPQFDFLILPVSYQSVGQKGGRSSEWDCTMINLGNLYKNRLILNHFKKRVYSNKLYIKLNIYMKYYFKYLFWYFLSLVRPVKIQLFLKFQFFRVSRLTW